MEEQDMTTYKISSPDDDNASVDADPIYHRDGAVTYWSVYQQQWVKHATDVPDRELAAMSTDEREKMFRHLTVRRARRGDY